MTDVETAVLDIIAKKANVGRGVLQRATELSSLNVDSLDRIEIMFEIEEAFAIHLLYNANQASSADGPGLKTAGDVVDLVAQQVNQGH
jgi:acyl carrier protein